MLSGRKRNENFYNTRIGQMRLIILTKCSTMFVSGEGHRITVTTPAREQNGRVNAQKLCRGLALIQSDLSGGALSSKK